MKGIARLAILGLALAGTIAWAQEEPDPRLFSYEAERYSEEAVVCENTAQQIAEHLAADFDVNVVDAGCVANVRGSYNLRVDYYAVQRVPLVSTAKPAGSMLDDPGRFEERADCEAALMAEAELFAAATGLQPDTFYCYKDDIRTGDLWMTKVEAFGESAVVPQLASAYVFSQVLGFSRSTFIDGIRQNAEARGLAVSAVKISPSFGYMTVTLLFYAEGRQRMENKEIIKLAKQEQCEEQLAETRDMLADSSLLLGFCTYTSITGYFEINTLGYGRLPADCYIPAVVYQSYEECRADRRNIADEFRDRLPKPVLGVLCGLEEDQWKPHVIMDNQ